MHVHVKESECLAMWKTSLLEGKEEQEWAHFGGAGHPGVVVKFLVQGIPQQVEAINQNGTSPQALHDQHCNAATGSHSFALSQK